MISYVRRIWHVISTTGVTPAHSQREKKDIILLNRAWLILIAIQSVCLVINIVNGLERSAIMTAAFIAGLSAINLFIRLGKINTAKVLIITVINCDTIAMAIFFGNETHVIDFLLLNALTPFYFFEIKNKKHIFWCTILTIIPYVIYYYGAPHLNGFALPVTAQLTLADTIVWEKVFCLVILLYLIFHKNADYEKDVHEKEMQIIGQKKLYECILEQIPIDIVTFDKQLRYSYVNSAAIEDPVTRKWLMGKTNVDYFKMRNMDIKVAEDRDRVLHEALEREETIEFEESFADRYGKIRHTIKGTSPIYSDDKKELLCLIGYSMDVTRMKEAEQKLKEYAVELERKNADLHHFVNATSHDLKSPLRNIASYLQILEKKNQGKLDDDSLSLISYTVKSVKHLNQLISDIYQYSVADRNDKEVEITDVTEVLKETLKELENVIGAKRVEIDYNTFPQLQVARSHISSVFSNLIGNAIKYNKAEYPRVTINCETTDKEYIFSIADNAIGIAEEYQRQIFDIFKRLHTPDEYKGTGVGLAICSKIIGNYGGRIWVTSELGTGSTFYFSFDKNMVSPGNGSSHKIVAYKKYAVAR